MADYVREGALQLDEKKKALLEELQSLKQKYVPGSGLIDDFPDPAFPHMEQSLVRSRLGAIELELQGIDQEIQHAIEQYFAAKNETE